MYFSDDDNNRIRKVTVSTGIITTIAGSSTSDTYSGDNGPATSATFHSPGGLTVDATGTLLPLLLLLLQVLLLSFYVLGNVYIADCGNHRVRKVTVTTLTPR